MSQLSRRIIGLSNSAFHVRAAPDQACSFFLLDDSTLNAVNCAQGGLLTGKDPTDFNTADPLRLWIIQVGQSIVPKVVL